MLSQFVLSNREERAKRRGDGEQEGWRRKSEVDNKCRKRSGERDWGIEYRGRRRRRTRLDVRTTLVTKITLCNKNDSKFPAADGGSDGGAVDNGASLSPVSPPFSPPATPIFRFKVPQREEPPLTFIIYD